MNIDVLPQGRRGSPETWVLRLRSKNAEKSANPGRRQDRPSPLSLVVNAGPWLKQMQPNVRLVPLI